MNKILDYFRKAGTARIVFVFLGNVLIGLGVAIFKVSQLGNDPFDGMNMALADLIGISYPVLQVIVNLLLFVIQLIFGRRLIGLGTIVNAVGLGYLCAFFFGIIDAFFRPLNLVLRIITVLVGVVITSLGLSFYQSADMGVAPYDALALIMNERMPKLPYFWARMICDACCALVCFLAGGIVGLGTLTAAFGLGPIIHFFDKTFTKNYLAKHSR